MGGLHDEKGNHGWYNEQNRRYMDDLWAYDTMANRWICLYPGADIDTLSLSRDANGFEVDSTGQPIPVTQNVHGYEMLSFDTDRGKFLWMPAPGGYDGILQPRRATWGAGWPGYRPSNCSPWMYDVATGKFELRPVSGPFVNDRGWLTGSGDVVVYVPSIKKTFVRLIGDPEGEVWFYDYATNSWTEVLPAGAPPWPAGYCVCYDSRRDRIYFAGETYFWTYDVQANAWIEGSTPPHSAGTNFSAMNYDSANDVVVLMNLNTEPAGVFVYSPDTDVWTHVSSLVIPPFGFWSKNSFYDPFLNVHFVHSAADNWEGTMQAYRYRRADSPSGPTVAINATDPGASEPGTDTGTFRVTRTGDLSSALTVTYSVGGAATSGADYVPLPDSVTLSPGASSATIAVTPVDDALAEGDETVVVTLSPGAAYTFGLPGSATVTIADDESGDSDGDGLPDTWETQHFGNLNEPGSGDYDGDGHTNLAEYQAGSDPTGAASAPGAGGGGNDSGCGATGMEIVLLLCFFRAIRRVPRVH